MESALAYLKPLYKKDASRIIRELDLYKKTLTIITQKSEDPLWYKSLDLYVVYPDGIIHNKKLPKLQNLITHMLHIKTLGCNAFHILPFLESPMVDRGFDISNYYKVREDLGTIEDIQNILKEAEKANIRVFMDLVFNHVSDKHEWFQKAQTGDKKFRNFFITAEKKPAFLGITNKGNAVWAKYLVHGKVIEVNIAFPEFAGAIPHWRLGEDGIWYYHTYYPQELDLNWFNPDVFIAVAKVMMYWGSMGFNFRLDAIPFIGKSAYKTDDPIESENTFLLIAALKNISENVNPESAFLVETYESFEKVLDYFGTANRIQANLAYNFHLCTSTWISLVTQDAKYIWENLEREKNIPKHADWINFLRNHDELSLAYLDDNLTEKINNELLPHGEPFREEYGIAGRTFPLVGYKYKRFLMAYFLLASFPGGIAIPYGDEIAYGNVPLYKMPEKERLDPRNINRGAITTKDFQKQRSKKISSKISSMLEHRKQLKDYLHVWPIKITTFHDVFGAVYKLGTSELFVYINLSNTKKIISKKLNGFQEIAGVNAHKVNGTTITLGPYAGVWIQK
jgi:maltose alpha-D-glucosyltransferase/alpha-amylase